MSYKRRFSAPTILKHSFAVAAMLATFTACQGHRKNAPGTTPGGMDASQDVDPKKHPSEGVSSRQDLEASRAALVLSLDAPDFGRGVLQLEVLDPETSRSSIREVDGKELLSPITETAPSASGSKSTIVLTNNTVIEKANLILAGTGKTEAERLTNRTGVAFKMKAALERRKTAALAFVAVLRDRDFDGIERAVIERELARAEALVRLLSDDNHVIERTLAEWQKSASAPINADGEPDVYSTNSEECARDPLTCGSTIVDIVQDAVEKGGDDWKKIATIVVVKIGKKIADHDVAVGLQVSKAYLAAIDASKTRNLALVSGNGPVCSAYFGLAPNAAATPADVFEKAKAGCLTEIRNGLNTIAGVTRNAQLWTLSDISNEMNGARFFCSDCKTIVANNRRILADKKVADALADSRMMAAVKKAYAWGARFAQSQVGST